MFAFFKGYSPKLIAVLVAGIPSMHICVDFVSELLQLDDHSKHLFAFELASRLCLHYRMPKQLAVGRLCLATMSTLITGCLATTTYQQIDIFCL